ncbi:MAG: hypothetical protein K6E16_04385 [Lachnospiraceae bacterium]|nr:hypothetical protein [Lachnospiraceae bacterium]
MKNNSRFPTKIMLLIRVAVGGYVLYLSWQLFSTRDTGNMHPALLAVILALFVICSLSVIIHSAYLYMKGMYAGGPADVEVEDSVEEAEQNSGSVNGGSDGSGSAEDGADGTGADDAGESESAPKALEGDTFSTEGAVDGEFREVD